MKPDDVIICRCEDVTLFELRSMLAAGYRDFETLKRLLRCTMGRCGGRSCRHLVLREIARSEKVSIADVVPPVYRPPMTPVSFEQLAEAAGDTDPLSEGGQNE